MSTCPMRGSGVWAGRPAAALLLHHSLSSPNKNEQLPNLCSSLDCHCLLLEGCGALFLELVLGLSDSDSSSSRDSLAEFCWQGDVLLFLHFIPSICPLQHRWSISDRSHGRWVPVSKFTAHPSLFLPHHCVCISRKSRYPLKKAQYQTLSFATHKRSCLNRKPALGGVM